MNRRRFFLTPLALVVPAAPAAPQSALDTLLAASKRVAGSRYVAGPFIIPASRTVIVERRSFAFLHRGTP